jgi:hypothetical protein
MPLHQPILFEPFPVRSSFDAKRDCPPSPLYSLCARPDGRIFNCPSCPSPIVVLFSFCFCLLAAFVAWC